ncbi:Alcohol dehydrogenase 3, mitochondrial [Labeo rohita]|uniref:Alcohol dehydrogenase 3, mitochondrial n=1 Tax=Labeo rohita TaxID=84645 RepID=A0ABQ8MSF3_LABRO|nr:Alcohol dehydrogenase 3, mitochondrial [Labeo rohita]
MDISGATLQWFKSYLSESVIRKHGFSYHCYADGTQLYFSFQPDDPVVAVYIAACLTDISGWMIDHHFQLRLAKKELLVNAAVRVVFNEPKKAHSISLFIGLQWLPIGARIKFRVLMRVPMFACTTITGSAPVNLNSLVQTYALSRSLLLQERTTPCGAIPKRYKNNSH